MHVRAHSHAHSRAHVRTHTHDAETLVCTQDGLRAYGKQPSWHWVCQVFYTAWGIVVLLSALYYTIILHRRWAFAAASALSFVLVMCSVVLLSVSIGGRDDASYFGMLTFLRLLEAAVGFSYLLGVRDYLGNIPAPSRSLDSDDGFTTAKLPSSAEVLLEDGTAAQAKGLPLPASVELLPDFQFPQSSDAQSQNLPNPYFLSEAQVGMA